MNSMKHSFFTLLLLFAIVCFFSPTKAQTTGTLTLSITTTEPAGNYNGVHVIAIWIEDTNGNFIKTKIRYADTRIQYLNKWVSASLYNVTDALTGPTRSGHGTINVSWNATDVAGITVPDNHYRVYVQMSDQNAAGASTFLEFAKDTNAQSLSLPDTLNFTNMTLSWTPVPAGISALSASALRFQCSPNPLCGPALIQYHLPEAADITITLHDVNGKMLALLADGNQPAGPNSLHWNQEQSGLPSGVYYLKLNTGTRMAVERVVIIR